jgi:hypothetical protein
MKNNLILASVLILLLITTYFFQEKRVEENHLLSVQNAKLIKNKIEHLNFSKLEALKKNGAWWNGNQLLSHNTFKLIEDKLNQIVIDKEIKGKKVSYFHDPISFDVNHEPFLLGDLSLNKSSFYISKNKIIYLAHLDGGSNTVSFSDDEVDEDKLNELKTLLLKKKDDLIENQLFRYYPELPMAKVVVHSEGGLAYELNLEKNTTNPAPIKGISIHEDLKGKFSSLLTQMQIKQEILFNDKLKFKKMAVLKFSSPNKKDTVWEIWLRDKKSADAVLFDFDQKRAFLMIGGTLKLFFLQVQDYWDKKIIPPKSFHQFQRLSADISQGNLKESIFILNREPLAFESGHYKVRPGSMGDLFQVIFNLGQFDQGDRVSQLTKTEKTEYLNNRYLKISTMSQDLVCIRKDHELIVANLTQGFKVHFFRNAQNYKCEFKDVLE